MFPRSNERKTEVTYKGKGFPIPDNPTWRIINDEVYPQEIGSKVPSDSPITTLAVLGGVLYAGDATGVKRLKDSALADAGGPKDRILRLRALNKALWCVAESAVWRLSGGKWAKIADGAFIDVCAHLGGIVIASASDLFRLEKSGLIPLNSAKSRMPILDAASYCETIYVRHSNCLAFLQDGRFEYFDVDDWGHLPLGSVTRDMLSFRERILVPTDKGLAELRGMTWRTITGKQGLCYEDTTCVAEGFADDVWIGTMRGAIRNVGGKYHFFGCDRWIPADKVNAIACGDNVAYIATDSGIGIIEYEPYTLQKKAEWYENWLEEWGQKRIGFINTLVWDGKRNEYVRFLSDNDGGWLCHYMNSLCYKYAVTKDPKVRLQAVEAFKAMKWTEEITPIPGFPARAIYAVGEKALLSSTGSGGLPAEWHETEDGKWQWKGDTSSDEVDAQIYSVVLFYELVAEGAEKEAAKEHIDRICSHIVENGWILRDLDGKPTKWARWDTDYLQRPEGFIASGLNGMEALSFIQAAIAVTGDDKFRMAKQQLLDWGYHKCVLRQKLVFPIVTHFDDRLAFLSYYPMLNYEDDPELRAIYRRSLERSWEVKRLDNMVWFSLVYSALTGNDCETDRVSEHLRDWPLDCRNYRYTNSHRHDLAVPEPYKNYVEDWKPMGPREVGVQRWDHNYQRPDGGGGKGVNEPSGWLDAYWMGRYYGIITAPTTTDKKLLTVKKGEVRMGCGPQPGAALYDGPEIPLSFK